ncbi:MAG: hypothetical protein E7536_03010 [Ruminococcaceae bacterium]|nr:hypothetical protein [Oscillospiraceae bacterium]
MDYWAERNLKTQKALYDKGVAKAEKQMAKYYKKAMDNVISSFEATHKKLLKTMEDGREPTPADLYKLDKYWQMQG